MSAEFFNDATYLDDIPQEKWKDYIGQGYRSCFYMNDADKNGKIVLLGFDKQGNRKTFIMPWRPHIAYTVKYKTDWKDPYDRYVAFKYFNSKQHRDNYVKNANGLNIIECLNPEMEFLNWAFDDCALDPTFNKQQLRIQAIDIETEISETFMRPGRNEDQSANRINMITIYDNFTDKYYTWSLQHAELDFKEDPLKDYPKDKFVFYEFNDDEYEMLEHFVSWLEDNYPDVSYGWNIKAYDWPYIVTRVEKVLGKNAARRISPVGNYFIKEINHDNSRADASADIEVKIAGLFIADGLIFYRDKFKTGDVLDGGYNLDNVGEHEQCGHKIQYDGTLKDLYLKDWQRFYEYNVRDVDLCWRIEKKRGMITLARQVSSFGLSDYNQIYGSIAYLINSVRQFAKTQMNGKVFTSYLPEKKNFPKFEGAFVFPTLKGVYRHGTGTIDFASLYPSCIRATNVSPETYVGKILIYFKDEFGNPAVYEELDEKGKKVGEWPVNKKNEVRFNPFSNEDSVWGKDDFGRKVRVVINAGDPLISRLELMLPGDKKCVPITVAQLKKLIEEKCIWTANNTLFLKHEIKWGVVAKWSEFFYNLRKKTKKEMFKYEHMLHDPKQVAKMTKQEVFEAETFQKNLETQQIAIKQMINSIYGCLGTNFSPIANPNIAQSVTRQGRFCNQSASKFILKRFQELYGAPADYPITIGGDTDSQFVNLKCMSEALAKKNGQSKYLADWPEEQKQELWDVASKFVDDEVNKFVRDLVHDYCHTSQQNVLTYELEYMTSRGCWEGKKHYYIHKIFEDGDRVDKVKVTGISLKKGETPVKLKDFLKDCYEGVLSKYWKQQDYEAYISKMYEEFTNLGIDDISYWRGYTAARESVGFLQMESGATIAARAANYYNQILKKLGLSKKYDQIVVGNKIRYCYLEKSNPYGIDVIGYLPGQWPKEFDKVFKVDYATMFDKMINKQLLRYREACGFSEFDPKKQVLQDIFEL